MEIEVDHPPKRVIITLVGSSDIASLKYLLMHVEREARESGMWPVGQAILDRLTS